MQQEDSANSLKFKVKRFLVECKRVLVITKKPDYSEFQGIVKVSGLGILLIGFIGFLVNLISNFIMGW
ncbi:protein translocase SEC61 complex subunit gamma [Candidatus Woesearchaeota archaeon]|nr:protein translocase SEC61 complex subunit gamma [Candidatus Woesearchaeota archaeon]